MKTFTAIPRSLTLGMLLAAASLFGSAAAADRININTADAATIDAALVKGIGLKTVEKNRDRMEFGASKPATSKPAKGK